MSDDLYEKLADTQHETWCHWMRYMFSSCGTANADGTFTIDAENVQRWQRLIDTPYKKLNEREKDSDREQVDRFWELIQAR